jgi:metal-responsive CopG/Arc/MetJ family transcriptional regulator
MNKKKEKVSLSLWIDKDLAEKIGELAIKGDMSRSRLCANLLEMGIEELIRMDKVGIYRLGIMLRDMREALRSNAKCLKENPSLIGARAAD